MEGELPEEGLAAYGDDGDDLLLALARQIVSGETDETAEPVEAVFAQAQAAAADAERCWWTRTGSRWSRPEPAVVAVHASRWGERHGANPQRPRDQSWSTATGRHETPSAQQQEELISWAEFLAQVPAQPKRRRKQPPASLPLFEWLLAQEQEAAVVSESA